MDLMHKLYALTLILAWALGLHTAEIIRMIEMILNFLSRNGR